jgi:hypothetical protein
MKDIYLLAVKQISAQSPLSDEWMDNPIPYTEPYCRAVDPDYKQYFTPNEARRLGKILKRALLTSRQVMETSGISNPDAIITGTGLGCIENTEIFLGALVREGEEFLKPTHFMQSTHNTIGSLIAIDAHCHGYNSTYAHKGISFECALLDAFMQLQNERIQSALVGAHDEMTPDYFTLLKRTGYLGHSENGFAGETAVSMMLGTEPTKNTLCRLTGVEMLYLGGEDKKLEEEVKEVKKLEKLGLAFSNFSNFLTSHLTSFRLDKIDAVMIGVNGNPANDRIYFANCQKYFPNIPLLQYKNLFGESYTAPALGVYAAATCLHQQRIPAHLFVNPENGEQRGIRNILCYNQFENKNHTFTLLSSCGD